jgi:hypothetical protein
MRENLRVRHLADMALADISRDDRRASRGVFESFAWMT